jgi:hypothetical protein
MDDDLAPSDLAEADQVQAAVRDAELHGLHNRLTDARHQARVLLVACDPTDMADEARLVEQLIERLDARIATVERWMDELVRHEEGYEPPPYDPDEDLSL